MPYLSRAYSRANPHDSRIRESTRYAQIWAKKRGDGRGGENTGGWKKEEEGKGR